MRSFLKKMAWYLLMLSLISGILLFIVFKNPNFIDRSYLKVTTPQATSLILGTSRAAQGFFPQQINSRVTKMFEGYIVNHSFTLGLSPYGYSYENFIKQKIAPNTKNGIFILEVSPYAFATPKQNVNDDSTYFAESHSFVGKISNSSTNPNIEYLTDYYSERHFAMEHLYNLIFDNKRAILDNNIYGSMSVTVKKGAVAQEERMKIRMASYRRDASNVKFSEKRYKSFIRTVKYLDGMGTVYIVRIPVSEMMKDMEEEAFPDFDDKIKSVAKKNNCNYFNYINDCKNYITTDGSHLHSESAQKLTEQICDSLLKYQKKN
jgi:hypothetical protein